MVYSDYREYFSSSEVAQFRRMEIDERCKQEAEWLIDHPKDSIRKVAREFGISKSQLHRDIQELKRIDDDLYVQCNHILNSHRRSRW